MRAKKRTAQASKADARIGEHDLPFKLGDQVLCRYSTYPYWPATVDTSHQAKARGKYYLVEQHPEKGDLLKFWCTFANEDTGGWVRVNRMVRFHPQLAEKIRVDRAHDYHADQSSAIEAAIKDFERFGGGEVPDMPADFENGGDNEDDEDDVDDEDLESVDEEEGEQAVEEEKKKGRRKSMGGTAGGKGEKRTRRQSAPVVGERPKKRKKEDEKKKEDAVEDKLKGLEARLESADATIAKLKRTVKSKENEIAEMTEGKNPVRIVVPPSPEGVDIGVPVKKDFGKKKMAAERFSEVMTEIKSDFESFKSIVKEVDSSRTALEKEKKKAQERFTALVMNVTTAERKAAKKEKSLCENFKKILEADIEVEALREHKAGNYIKIMGRQCKDMRILNEFCNSIYDTWKAQVKAWTSNNHSSAGGKSAAKEGKGQRLSKTDEEGDVVMKSGDVENDESLMPPAVQGNGADDGKADAEQDGEGVLTQSAKKSRKTMKDSRSKEEKIGKSDVQDSVANGSQGKTSNVKPDVTNIATTTSEKDSDEKAIAAKDIKEKDTSAKDVTAEDTSPKKGTAKDDVMEDAEAKDSTSKDIETKDDANENVKAKDIKGDDVDKKSAETQDASKKAGDATDIEMKDTGAKEATTKGGKDRKRRATTKRKGSRVKDTSEEAEAKGTVGKGKQRKDPSADNSKGKDLDHKKQEAEAKLSDPKNPVVKGAQVAGSKDVEPGTKGSDDKELAEEESEAKVSGVKDSRSKSPTGMKDPGKKDAGVKDSDVKDSEAKTLGAEDAREKSGVDGSEDKDSRVDSKDKESKSKDSKSREPQVRASRASKSGIREAKRKDAGVKDRGSGAGGSKVKDSGGKGRRGKDSSVKGSKNEDSDIKDGVTEDAEKHSGDAKATGDGSGRVSDDTRAKEADVKSTDNTSKKAPGTKRGKKADLTVKGAGSQASEAKATMEVDTKSSHAVGSKSKSNT